MAISEKKEEDKVSSGDSSETRKNDQKEKKITSPEWVKFKKL